MEAIGELELPEGEEAQAEAFIAAMEEGIETTEDNTYTAANIEELGREFHKAGKLAQKLLPHQRLRLWRLRAPHVNTSFLER